MFTNDIIKSPYFNAEWPLENFKIGNGVFVGDVLGEERRDIKFYGLGSAWESSR